MNNPHGCPYQVEDGYNDRNRFPHGHLFVGEIENGKRYPYDTYSTKEADERFAKKGTETDLAELSARVDTKASQADLTALENVVNTKANQTALNILSDEVDTKAAITDLEETNAALNGKADKTTTDSLQSQINQIIVESEAEAVVAPEVGAARVAVDNTEYETLKERLDADYNQQFGALNLAINASNIEEICQSDANNLPNDQVYSVGLTSLVNIDNFPASKGMIITFGRNKTTRYNGDVQYFITDEGKVMVRNYWTNAWKAWVAITDQRDIEAMEPAYLHSISAITDSNVQSICSGNANNLGNNKMYSCGMEDAEVTNFPSKKGFIATFGTDGTRRNGDVQLHFNATGTFRTRVYWANAWLDWALNVNDTYIENREKLYCLGSTLNITDDNVADICDSNANNLPNNRIYGMGMLSAEVENFPQKTGCIITIGKGSTRGNGDLQIHFSGTNTIRTRVYWANAWLDWNLNANSTYVTNRETHYMLGGDANINNTTAETICDNDFDNLPNNRIYGVGLTSAIAHAPALLGNIVTFGKSVSRTNSDTQVFISNSGVMYSRIYWGSAWTAWTSSASSAGIPAVRVLALGDSICNGVRNNHKGFIGDVGVPYDNIGVSGATLSTKVDNVKNIPQQLIDYTPTNQPDVIISNGGVNDYYFAAPLGTVPEVPVTNDTAANALDRSTVIGGLQYLLYKMISLYPKAQRFFLLTHKTTARASNTSSTIVDWTVTANAQGYTQRELFAAIKTTCDVYGVKVIDVFGESMINTTFDQYKSATPYSEDSSVTYTEFVDSDGIHPLAYGYQRGYVPFVKQALIASSPR